MRLIYPYLKNKRFYNYKYDRPESFLLGTIPSIFNTVFNRKKISKEELAQWITKPQLVERSTVPRITWIGHATFLIQVGGLNILTDPVFGSPFRFFKRLLPPGISLNQLPPLDIVLISHNHFDHMEKMSLEILKFHNCSFLIPLGDKAWFIKKKFPKVYEYSWWEKHKIERDGILHDMIFSFLPAFHWSGRSLFDKNRSLWGSWMISHNDQHIYFAGDTAYGPHFEQIGIQFPQITTALLPIGPVEPFQWMKHNHMNGEQAVKAFVALKAQQLIPMHWGTFALGTESFLTPLDILKTAWQEYKDLVINKNVSVLQVGQTLVSST